MQEIVSYMINKTMEVATVFERSHELVQPKHRITIQQLDGTDEIEPFQLLLPEDTPAHLIIDDSFTAISEYEYERSTEEETLEDRDGFQQDESVIFWLPRNICLVKIPSFILASIYEQTFLFKRKTDFSEG